MKKKMIHFLVVVYCAFVVDRRDPGTLKKLKIICDQILKSCATYFIVATTTAATTTTTIQGAQRTTASLIVPSIGTVL
jgi:hypothetical protein